MNRRSAPFLLPLLVLALAGPARATVMLEASVDELAVESDAVVRGTVKGSEGRLSADGKRIFTEVTVEVAEAWKGAPGKSVRIRVPGGVHGGYGQIVQGAPRFELGEDVVVFLRKAPGAAPDAGARPLYRVSALAQGKLRVSRDAEGVEVAVPDLEGVELKKRPDLPAVKAPKPVPVKVGELRARVEAASR